MKENVQIVLAIVAGVIIIGGSIWYTKMTGNTFERPNNNNQKTQTENAPVSSDVKINRIQEGDRVRGAADAPITIVQYSDTECPFCKRLHNTLIQVVDEYEGKVNWTFRHFPVHKKSIAEASAAECAGEIKGNDFFWQYIDKIFATTEGNDKLDLTLLPKFADELGIDKLAFEKCLSENKFEAKIKKDYQDVVNAGAEGTPYSVVFGKNGEKIVVNGAQPIENFRKVIDFLLAE